jgi:hypothetical protein
LLQIAQNLSINGEHHSIKRPLSTTFARPGTGAFVVEQIKYFVEKGAPLIEYIFIYTRDALIL